MADRSRAAIVALAVVGAVVVNPVVVAVAALGRRTRVVADRLAT
ncbi:hypothetical protein O7600_07175 [Micromonospora sp. WMMA1998]|nr:hypothetical protein [Micromonospora sp. WMMA1998]WBC16615.1 hypothetical protein O7600_07175 [Micromonospora sp. WMMA1998]